MTDFAAIYTAGALMGLDPITVDALSLGQWVALSRGWAKAHADSRGAVAPPTEREFFEAVAGANDGR